MKNKSPKHFCRETGKLKRNLDRSERMSTQELAAFLPRKTEDLLSNKCPVCKSFKSEGFKLCKDCYKKGRKFAVEVNLRRAKAKFDLQKTRKLPAVNRKKSKVINSLLGTPKKQQLKATSKPKTIRYRSMETVLEEIRVNNLLSELDDI